MNEAKKVERELEDNLIMSQCKIPCCWSCDKYKLVKDQAKFCQVVKARKRTWAREVREFDKKGKSCNIETGECE